MTDLAPSGAAPELALDLPANVGGGDDGYSADLAAEIEASRDEPTEAGADDPSYSSDIRAALEEQGAAGHEENAERAWRRELNEYLAPHREALGALGKGSKEAIRRLFKAEKALRENPAGGLAWLAQSYASQLDPQARAQAAVQVLQSLGFDHGSQIQAHERQQIEAWRQQQAQQQQEWQAAESRAEQTIAEFARTRPDFGRLRPTMAALMQSGRAVDLESAYALASRLEGLSAPPAQSTAMASQEAVAKAKAARTPRSSSYGSAPASEDADDGAGDYKSALLIELNKSRAGGRR